MSVCARASARTRIFVMKSVRGYRTVIQHLPASNDLWRPEPEVFDPDKISLRVSDKKKLSHARVRAPQVGHVAYQHRSCLGNYCDSRDHSCCPTSSGGSGGGGRGGRNWCVYSLLTANMILCYVYT